MSDLSDLSNVSHAVTQSSLQPHVSTYFDEHVLKDEIQLLYRDGPGYVGHTHWVPECGDWRSLPWEGDGRILVNNGSEIEPDAN